ncbi:uncharacterized protein LOC122954407 [Acropora millepora]|nr:uncharacterized protein LOC122954407 [Acropora millepora]
MGASSELKTTGQRVETKKRKQRKNFTGLDESISQDDVLLIAHELGSLWKMVGRALKVPKAVIDEIEADESKVSEKCYTVLTSWQERCPKDATYHRLALALKHPAVGRADLADKYCSL